jgi:hypothetical protein
MARQLKDEGDVYLKEKDYPKAISKWCKVELLTKPFLPARADGKVDDKTQEEMLEL